MFKMFARYPVLRSIRFRLPLASGDGAAHDSFLLPLDVGLFVEADTRQLRRVRTEMRFGRRQVNKHFVDLDDDARVLLVGKHGADGATWDRPRALGRIRWQ